MNMMKIDQESHHDKKRMSKRYHRAQSVSEASYDEMLIHLNDRLGKRSGWRERSQDTIFQKLSEDSQPIPIPFPPQYRYLFNAQTSELVLLEPSVDCIIKKQNNRDDDDIENDPDCLFWQNNLEQLINHISEWKNSFLQKETTSFDGINNQLKKKPRKQISISCEMDKQTINSSYYEAEIEKKLKLDQEKLPGRKEKSENKTKPLKNQQNIKTQSFLSKKRKLSYFESLDN
jgi:hypothetical protein